MLKAGAGKSTLIKFIIAAMNINPDAVRYVAYTGKAANVLKNKGCPGATTAHKLLYKARLMPNGKYKFSPRSKMDLIEEGIEVVVVDEVSMLPKKIWDLLCSHSFYILACGDPEQLPPIAENKGEDPNNHILDHPHVFLDEIMRQAQESEIIRLSMHVREGKSLETFPVLNEQVMIFNRYDLTDSMLLWADQVLCATTKNRVDLNNRIRRAKGFMDLPQVGDKIINLHNEWEFLSSHGNPLTNGVIGEIVPDSMCEGFIEYPEIIKTGKFSTKLFKVPTLLVDIYGDEDGEKFQGITLDYNELLTGTPSFNGEQEYRALKRELFVPFHMNYGYAITVWKAQGSEWDKVLLIQEKYWPNDPDARRKFLYTGITRAINKLVVIK